MTGGIIGGILLLVVVALACYKYFKWVQHQRVRSVYREMPERRVSRKLVGLKDEDFF